MRRYKLALACGILTAGTSTLAQSFHDLPFRGGEPFPDVVLPALADGRPGSVAELRGTKLVLHVFASW
jgi:hypothetical protein